MSKNKNPLKDLDLFLKQQAASFVSPTPLSEKIQVQSTSEVTQSFSEETTLQSIERLLDQNPSVLYDMLIEAAEKKNSAERTMLINTALYLKNTSNLPTGQVGWKEAIREYWRKK
jgi:hypothetical protein